MNPISLRSPGDVVAVLPYQLGYHPHDSVVLVALRDRAVVLVGRLDLPPPDEVDAAARMLVGPVRHEEPDTVLLVGYETDDGQARPVLDAARDHLVRAGLQVLDRVVVRAGRWFAVDCETDCCPADGIPVPQPADTPAVSEFVGLGVAPLSSRGDLADLVAADPDRTPAVAQALAERAARAARDDPGRLLARRFEALSLWAVVLGLARVPEIDPRSGSRSVGLPDLLPDLHSADDAAAVEGVRADQVALLVESLQDLELRDALVAWLCPGTMPDDCLSEDLRDAVGTCLPRPSWSEDESAGPAVRALGTGPVAAARQYQGRLQHLVRAVPDEHAPAFLTVLANLAWWTGDGALARTCLDRALAADPGYRLAVLLEQMVDLGIRTAGPGQRRPRSGRAGHRRAGLV